LLPLRAAPARSLAERAGALVLALTAVAACESAPGTQQRATLQVGDTTIDLGGIVTVHDVSVAQMTRGDFDPPSVTAHPGDVLHFQTVDMRTHALAFDEDLLQPEVRTALAQKQQLRSPPLVTEGTSWIVSLDGVPPGTYRITCLTHNAPFTIQVR